MCRTNVTSWSRVTPGSQADDEKVKCGYFMTESIVIKELLYFDGNNLMMPGCSDGSLGK